MGQYPCRGRPGEMPAIEGDRFACAVVDEVRLEAGGAHELLVQPNEIRGPAVCDVVYDGRQQVLLHPP